MPCQQNRRLCETLMFFIIDIGDPQGETDGNVKNVVLPGSLYVQSLYILLCISNKLWNINRTNNRNYLQIYVYI